jgi:hypothetical protein
MALNVTSGQCVQFASTGIIAQLFCNAQSWLLHSTLSRTDELVVVPPAG